jgi:hypothetical protein
MAFKNMQYEKLLNDKKSNDAAQIIEEEEEADVVAEEEEEDQNEDVFMIDESIPFEYEALIKGILLEKNLIPKGMDEDML